MRLDASAAGAVACLLVAGAVAKIPPATMMEARESRKIKFQEFSPYLNYGGDTKIQWELLDSSSGIRITNVSLYRIQDNGWLEEVPVGEGQQETNAHSLGLWAVGNSLPQGTREKGTGYKSVGARNVSSEPVPFDYSILGANGSATLAKDEMVFGLYREQELINAALCLTVGLYNGEIFIRAYSHAFAITENKSFSDPFFKTLNETFAKASAYAGRYEGPDPPSSLAPYEAASADADSKGGLSTAAKAGIGVGAGLGGLLLIGGLVFLFCRRRRRRGPKPYGRGAGGDFASDSGVMVRDKEMAGVSQSGPHSLYASDPGRLHEHDTPADSPVVGGDSQRYSGYGGGGGGGGDRQHSSYHGGGDDPRRSGYLGGGGDAESYHAEPAPVAAPGHHPASERSVGVSGDAPPPPPTTATPHYAPSRPTSEVRSPSRYAHLIEEGMTPDEIQRLEEEERQLDAAIENAGRRSRSA